MVSYYRNYQYLRGWLGVTMWHVLCAHTVTSVLCAQTTVLRSPRNCRLFPQTHTHICAEVPRGTYLWPPGPGVSAPSRWAGRGLCGTPHCSGWRCSAWSASSLDHPPRSASCPSSSQNLHGIWSVHRNVRLTNPISHCPTVLIYSVYQKFSYFHWFV